MNIDDMTIGDLKEIKKFLQMQECEQAEAHPHPYIGKRVIVRTYASGVHLATLKEYNPVDRDAFLLDSQRIYSWSGAFTLSKVATEGVENGRISCIVPEMHVTQIAEFIPISEKAEQSIKDLGIHNE